MAQSQDSSMTMSELFPELDTQVAIRFQKAGNKTQRRFSDAKKWKECQSSWTMALWEESSLEGRIKGNVRQVALSMVSRSPNDKQHLEASMKKLEADQRLQKQKRAFMEAHHCSTWDECQTMLLKLYVLPAEEREESMREAALHSTRNATPTAREVKPQRSSNPFD
uniref:Uncharacterized protein n=1 Tax=Craspedostauros australis TaxID=1486917 RepID=A0A7R9ZIU7_9STRA|mmetsp:Transcript_13360/g.36941  ORF Transcript_13360/g.36941 Transcript_13360/m.36941 type:complete len:166 (+) Transcript_13360:83-580(+)